ncbi:stage II sporulation protein R [Paludifilum halophilum]|uniref:Stage II sporulation protein R n=1 Tax=Paludifilum halophilum TaxID=1642702 RepID=A0A235B812_9BACL|nr:stage II sporulation protein R [Paludifilum halophilum]OYD07997.1 stage II sporulation protein R [Paludifilum halophilum]
MRVGTYSVLLFLSIGFFLLIQSVSGAGSGIVSYAAAGAQSEGGGQNIPDEAIRLRILANSDRLEDQALKRRVRDAVLAEIKAWADKPDTIGEARRQVRSHLSDFQKIADRTVRQQGYDYEVQVDYGRIPFPTKLYGDQVYPAGKYEALRITIGEGKGDNWWCVLFPPLCFVDMSNGDAVPKSEQRTASAEAVAAEQALAAPERSRQSPQGKPVEVRFFFLDSLKDFFSGLFD